MPRGGVQHTSASQAERLALETRNYTQEEIAAELTMDEIMSVQAHHLAQDASTLLTRPVPQELEAHNAKGAHILKTNSTMYEDAIEDAFDADTKLKEIYLLGVSQQRVELIRTRRTVLGYLALSAATKETKANGDQDVA